MRQPYGTYQLIEKSNDGCGHPLVESEIKSNVLTMGYFFWIARRIRGELTHLQTATEFAFGSGDVSWDADPVPQSISDGVLENEIYRASVIGVSQRGASSASFGSISASGGGVANLTDDHRAEPDDYWVGATIEFFTGINAGLTRVITSSSQSNRSVSWSGDLPIAVSSGDGYRINSLNVTSGLYNRLEFSHTMDFNDSRSNGHTFREMAIFAGHYDLFGAPDSDGGGVELKDKGFMLDSIRHTAKVKDNSQQFIRRITLTF